MLEHAIQLAEAGKSVYIIASNQRDVNRIQSALDNPRIRVETPERTLDWQSMTLRGTHPNCVVLCDHYTIESRFDAMIKMLHAYD